MATHHLSDDALQALLDGELPFPEREAAEHHLNGCAQCAAQWQAANRGSQEFSEAIRALDVAPPTARAYQRFTAWRRHTRHQHVYATLRRAAILVLAVGGVASATVPGSPVRHWLADRFAPVPEAPLADRDFVVATETTPPPTGISVAPREGRVSVAIEDAASDLEIRVRLVDATRVRVEASGEAAAAQFRTSPGRLDLLDTGGGEIAVTVPQDVAEATVLVNGSIYLAKDGDQLRVLSSAADSAGPEVILRVLP